MNVCDENLEFGKVAHSSREQRSVRSGTNQVEIKVFFLLTIEIRIMNYIACGAIAFKCAC